MGNRNIRQRETKKPKKDVKKVTSSILPMPVPEVQLIKTKGKKPREEELEEE